MNTPLDTACRRQSFRLTGHKWQRGLTLNELVVTLAVTGILATTAVPALREFIIRQRLVATVNTLVGALHLARSEAIRRSERVALCPSRDGFSCLDSGTAPSPWHHGYIQYLHRNANPARDPDEPLLRHFEGVDRLRIYTSPYRDYIIYQPDGQSSGTNATFLICDPDGRIPARQVILSNGGRPRVTHTTETCAEPTLP